MAKMTPTQWSERKEHWNQQHDDGRSYYDVDYARIMYSASFRRLQGKTQILNLGDSDFYRTRLTHSLEVSQIAMGVVQQIKKFSKNRNPFECHKTYKYRMVLRYLPSEKLIAAIGATHDLGHPPFGHGGEVALNFCMRNDGGFEGNAQTLRILTKLEMFSEEAGANLSRRTLLGCLKYPNKFSELKNSSKTPSKLKSSGLVQLIDRKSCNPPKCYFDEEESLVDWLLDPLADKDRTEFVSFTRDAKKHSKTKHQSFDCSIMNLADDISYGVHDFEDGLALNLINEQAIETHISECGFSHFISSLNLRYSDEKPDKKIDYKSLIQNFLGSGRKRYIGRLVHYFLTNIEITESDFDEPLLRYGVKLNQSANELLEKLKTLVKEEVIFSPNVQQLEFKGQRMVIEVFEILNSEPDKFLPLEFRHLWQKEKNKKRVICDYIAGMTDGYLLKTYERLCSPRMGSVFDYL